MNLRANITILCIGLLTACTGSFPSGFPRYGAFPETKTITAQALSLDTVLFRYPYRVSVRDSIAVVMDLHNTDYFFHAFRYPAWEHITSFGKRGEGPEEILSAATFQFNSLDSIWALDANRMQLTRWSVSPASRSAERQEAVELDKSLVRSLDFLLTDKGILVPGYLGECRYWEVGHDGKPIKSIGEIPTELYKTEEIKPALAQAWRSFMDYNPKNGVLALVTQLGEVLELYNLKDGSHVVLYGPNGEPEFKASRGEGFPTGIMGFSDVQVTDRYVYAIFEGVRFKDKIAAHKRGENPEEGGHSIYVYDLQGRPVRQYVVDRPMRGLDVHEDTGTIFATCVESDEPIIELKI